MISAPEALRLLDEARTHLESSEPVLALRKIEDAAMVVAVLTMQRPDEAWRAAAHAQVQAVMRKPEHVSKPLGRVLEQLARKVEG